ncbi:MAG: hypothetical protein LJE95_11135 [Acidobacteria bacterium]|nr:hypothetical protein [Acidobacteriota bacterium]
MTTKLELDAYAVILVRASEEVVVFSGDLEACQDWLVMEGDSGRGGHYEIRPLDLKYELLEQ